MPRFGSGGNAADFRLATAWRSTPAAIARPHRANGSFPDAEITGDGPQPLPAGCASAGDDAFGLAWRRTVTTGSAPAP
jgi:hypothetical protein